MQTLSEILKDLEQGKISADAAENKIEDFLFLPNTKDFIEKFTQTKPVNNKMRGFHGWRDEFGNELICPVRKQLLEVKRVAANYGIDFTNITDNDLIETLINDKLSESIIKLKNIHSENIIETKRIAEAMRGVFNSYKKNKNDKTNR